MGKQQREGGGGGGDFLDVLAYRPLNCPGQWGLIHHSLFVLLEGIILGEIIKLLLITNYISFKVKGCWIS